MIKSFEGRYDFLSNFYHSEITIEDIAYPTVEHAFQAAKTLSHATRLFISNLETPGKAKRAGQAVTLRSDWETVKDDVMLHCLREKFANPLLGELLLDTGNQELIEGNTWHDNYWGDCRCEKCAVINGKNTLGKLLMQVRNELSEAKQKRHVLVVVDMQNDFVTGALGSKEAQAIVPYLQKKLATTNATEIIFTRDTHSEDYMNTQEGKKLPVPHCIKGTDGWKIIPELQEFTKGARIIDKPTFGSMDLAHYFNSPYARADVETEAKYITIEFVGVCTDICVISNAMLAKASLPEATIVIDAKGCAGVTPESHENALNAMRQCQIDVT